MSQYMGRFISDLTSLIFMPYIYWNFILIIIDAFSLSAPINKKQFLRLNLFYKIHDWLKSILKSNKMPAGYQLLLKKSEIQKLISLKQIKISSKHNVIFNLRF